MSMLNILPPRKQRRRYMVDSIVDMKPDQQRERAYKWEDTVLFRYDEPTSPLTPIKVHQLDHIVNALNNVFMISRPASIKYDPKRGGSQQHGDKIVIGRQHMFLEIVLHEYAHHIQFNAPNTMHMGHEGHGPEWLTIYMILLITCAGYNKDYLIISADHAGLRFYPTRIEKVINQWTMKS